MLNARALFVGSLTGFLPGVALTTYVAVAHGLHRAECPPSWTPARAFPLRDAEPLATCHRAGTDGRRDATVSLYRTHEAAAPRTDEALRALETSISHAPAHDDDAPDRTLSPNGLVAVSSQTFDLAQVPLVADIYFIAAGHRFGLLDVVHASNASFGRLADTARWMSTITGVAPWGAPNPEPMRARCPDGFQPQPTTRERAVVSCQKGAGTAEFTVVTLNWDEGGFASDDERAQVASSLAARVTEANGTHARVVVGPEPFTLARGVDALHTRVDTGETVAVSARVIAANAPQGAPDILALGSGDPDANLVPVASAMFETSGATMKPFPLTVRRAALVALVLGLLGALAGAFAARAPRD